MPSPFPGMNPYLEHPHFWPDFHATFIPALREALTAKVSPDYFVAVQEHVYIRESDDDRKLIGAPDVDVTFSPSSQISPKRRWYCHAACSCNSHHPAVEEEEGRLFGGCRQ